MIDLDDVGGAVEIEAAGRRSGYLDEQVGRVRGRLDERVKAHVLICMLACYLIWHLRKAWAPLTFTDETPPHRDKPVAPAGRSTAARAASTRAASSLR